MSKIYTKTGDSGETGLVDGKRVSKGDQIISCYGEVDELNSHVGVILSFLDENFLEIKADLLKVQHTLFDLGSLLACPIESREKYKLKKIQHQHILFLESSIDKMNETLPELRNFILPGGCRASSVSHVARSVCRRVERSLVQMDKIQKDYLPENALMYVNRLSDYFFVLSRYINFLEKESEVLWRND